MRLCLPVAEPRSYPVAIGLTVVGLVVIAVGGDLVTRGAEGIVSVLGLSTLLGSMVVTPAAFVKDRAGTRLLLVGLGPLVPRLKKIWADGAYSRNELAGWCEEQGRVGELEVVERDKEAKGFEVVPKRWILERTFGWLHRDRGLKARDYERKVKTSETLMEVAMIQLMLRRLARAA